MDAMEAMMRLMGKSRNECERLMAEESEARRVRQEKGRYELWEGSVLVDVFFERDDAEYELKRRLAGALSEASYLRSDEINREIRSQFRIVDRQA